MKFSTKPFLLLAGLVALAAPRAESAELTGVVTDPDGFVIGGADEGKNFDLIEAVSVASGD